MSGKPDTSESTNVTEIAPSRRDAIRIGVAALASLGISALSPATAFATTGTMQYGADNNAGADVTSLNAAVDGNPTLAVSNTSTSGGGNALWCENASSSSTGASVYSSSNGTGAAVFGWTTSAANSTGAVYGLSSGNAAQGVLGASEASHADARGVKGELLSAIAQGSAVEGVATGTFSATGVSGRIGAGGSGTAIRATNEGDGAAIRAEIANADSSAVVVSAQTTGSGTAILGRTDNATALAATIVGQSGSDHPGARAVWGLLDSFTSAGWAVEGRTLGSGGGMLAQAVTPSTGLAMRAWTNGTGGALKAQIDNVANSAPAIMAQTSRSGYAIHAEGGKAQLYLKPASSAGAPTAGTHEIGEVYVDAVGVVYQCSAAGTPGTWGALVRTGSNAGAVAVKSGAAGTPALKAQGSASNGAALRVEGTMTMTRSGKAKISKGHSTTTVTVPGGLTSGAIIVCTPQNSGGSGVYLRYATRISSTQFKIALSKSAGANVYVGWMVLG